MAEVKGGLERLAELVTPPDDAFDRLARKRSRRQRNRRVGAALVALALAGAGMGTALIEFGRSGIKPLPALRIRHGYGIQFPDGPLGYEKKGLAVVDAATNLPDGTKVSLYLFGADVESPGQAVVKDGRIPIRIWNGFCHETEQGIEGTTTKVTVVVSPVSQSITAGGRVGAGHYSPQPQQPLNVQKALGPNFERLTGEQVIEDNGRRLLVASKLVRLPADTCQKKYGFTKDGSYELLPVDQPVTLPPGPFPKSPFTSCPDPDGALPVEAGDWQTTGEVAAEFDAALTAGNVATLRQVADPSVDSFDSWISTNSSHPAWIGNVPFGDPAVATGCGALIYLRTVGAQLARAEGENPAVTYLLILRSDGWKVWGQLPGDGQ